MTQVLMLLKFSQKWNHNISFKIPKINSTLDITEPYEIIPERTD